MAFIKLKKKFLIVVPFIALTVLLADQISVQLFKEIFLRLRPCHTPTIADFVHTVNNECGGLYGFISSHAANTFSVAFFIGLLLKKHYPWLLILLLVWASIVSYSRIYLGVHFPGDILGGILVGSLIGIGVFKVLMIINKKFHLQIDLRD